MFFFKNVASFGRTGHVVYQDDPNQSYKAPASTTLHARILKAIEEKKDLNEKDVLGKTFLHEACCDVLDVESINLLLENGVDVNVRDSQQQTVLHYLALQLLDDDSCISGCLPIKSSIVSTLIAKGARIDLYDVNGNSPLHLAATMGNVDFIKVCRDNVGCDVFKMVLAHKNAFGKLPY